MDCATKHVEVSFPPGNVVGVVQGNLLEYTAHNPSGDLLFLLHRESKTCCEKPGYVVETTECHPLGSLERVRAPGCCRGRRVMEVNFPGDLDLRWKALLLAGALVIQYLKHNPDHTYPAAPIKLQTLVNQ
ncbi:hypothetical protein GWK47_027355 [Chionoecetes opilio]|uniref:Phospholipid scramblase n=1 Tax=Chionoecetes opilio TaxID=41210 RepID=A0A8J8WA44_CHIOP|nr:hypothetical protein GWK47_027355 [Chionoecetes opilio]